MNDAISSDTLFGESLLDGTQPVQEKDLIFPMLLILAHADKNNHGPVTTFQFYTSLKDLVVMSEEDEQKVRADRNTSRFKRTLHNVFSHDLLTREKWAERQDNGWVITPRGRAHLLDYLTPLQAPPETGSMTVVERGGRVLESAVALQMMFRLADLQQTNKAPVSTTQLRKEIKSSFVLTVADLQPLKNRNDTRIDQIVRNVISHNTLTKSGWCTRNEKGLSITDKGKALLLDYVLQNIPSPDFGFLLRKDQSFRAQVNQRRAEVATDAAARRKMKQKP